MRLLLFCLGIIAGIIVLFPHSAFAATCDQIVWDAPAQQGAYNPNTPTIYTFSGKISNCPGQRRLRLKVQYQRTQTSDPVITQPLIELSSTDGALRTDVPFNFPVTVSLTLYDVDNNDNVIVNPNCNTVPENLKNNAKCNWVYYISIKPSGAAPVTPGVSGTPSQSGITCNATFSYTGDQSLLICPKDCPTLVNLQGTNYQCSTQNLTNLPLETKDVKIVLKPKAGIHDTYIMNTATAQYSGVGSGGGGTGTQTPINSDSTDFSTLMTGQGRNTTLFPSAEAFADAAIKNVGYRFTNQSTSTTRDASTYRPYLIELYNAAVAKNVNPAITLTIWGVEESFVYNTHSFNCPPPREGTGQTYTEQLNCSINSINNLMKDYESKAAQGQNPVKIPKVNGGGSCDYTDPFLYAYEMYTPVCHASDENDNAHKNFVTIFREILGLK